MCAGELYVTKTYPVWDHKLIWATVWPGKMCMKHKIRRGVEEEILLRGKRLYKKEGISYQLSCEEANGLLLPSHAHNVFLRGSQAMKHLLVWLLVQNFSQLATLSLLSICINDDEPAGSSRTGRVWISNQTLMIWRTGDWSYLLEQQ